MAPTWAPDDLPWTKMRSRSPPKVSALRQIQAMASRHCRISTSMVTVGKRLKLTEMKCTPSAV
jgi:hypothetical protein